jgi:hypothetical protein
MKKSHPSRHLVGGAWFAMALCTLVVGQSAAQEWTGSA